MWINAPGSNRTLGVLAWILALAVLSGTPALAKAKEETPAPAPAPVAEPEITFNGKVFCSLKRRVDFPFKGVITSLRVRSGEKVVPGQVLATYRLTPEALLQIHQRLYPPQIAEAEVKLAETERSLVSLSAKQEELAKLAANKLTSRQSLEQSEKDLGLLTKERTALQVSLRQNRQLAQDDRAFLQSQLGNGLGPAGPSEEIPLQAPIGGYVIWVQPELRVGALLDPTPGVFQVGVMDPMLVRGQAFEIEALQIKPGESAEITLESLPGRKFLGEVTRISWSSQTPGLDQPAYYDVELKVANPEMLLKDGLKAQIVFPKPR